MSFKPEVKVGNDPKFYSNALTFATRKEAEDNAQDLFNRWTLCVDHRAVESTDPVTHAYIDGVLAHVPKEANND
jgi:hypothetical protein